MFDRCYGCKKRLFFKKNILDDHIYCEDCLKKASEIKQAEEKKRQEIEKQKRAIERNRLADERLREELKKEAEKQNIVKKKVQKKKDTQSHAPQKRKVPKKKIYFSEEQTDEHELLLYIEVDVKRAYVIEWLRGKRRVVLNKRREIRRTHAGGFSAEKFQKFVDSKKKKTFEWVADLLQRPGVLREKYDVIKVVSKDEELKSAVERFLKEKCTP